MTGFNSKREAATDKVQEVRGFLASQLKCWHRLTGEESDELVALFEAQPPQRTWIWLSDADIAEVVDTTCQYSGGYEEYLIKKAEQKIKSMNT